MKNYILKTVGEQYDEGLIAICSKCLQLTYNTNCFVCTNCEENKNE